MNWEYVRIYEKHENASIFEYAGYDYDGPFPKYEGLILVGYVNVPDDECAPLEDGDSYLIDEYGNAISPIDMDAVEHGEILAEHESLPLAISWLQDRLDSRAIYRTHRGSILDGDPDEYECVGIQDWE